MPTDPIDFLALVQAGGTKPLEGKFDYGAGLAIVVVVAFIVGLVLVALLLAGRRRR